MSDRVTRRLIVQGRVQGVFYRESMRQEAQRLGVTGWVCNRRDGAVEALVQGAPDAVEAIIAWARKGPSDAKVSGVGVEQATGDFSGFEKRPTF